MYPAEIIEQTCAFSTQTRRVPLWCPSVLFMLTVVMETDYTLWIMDRAKMTQEVWTGPNSGPVYPSGAQCRSPVVQTPVTSGRPAQVLILLRTLMLYILSAAKHFWFVFNWNNSWNNTFSMLFLLSVNYMWVQNPQRLFKGWEANVLPENCENAKHTEHESVLHGCHEVQQDWVWTSVWRSLCKFLIVHQSVEMFTVEMHPLLICTENALMFYSHSQHAMQ